MNNNEAKVLPFTKHPPKIENRIPLEEVGIIFKQVNEPTEAHIQLMKNIEDNRVRREKLAKDRAAANANISKAYGLKGKTK